ncbi:CidA/LrgA family protein [Bacillus sp. REN16]|uniref:CidA/LrgA family protein n=1 Tax=Bacillus sp. REN16 TaxID=2887296 RepID=UPI001E48D5C0|nr:CidA/LrgA family holin-like protein [Bacillus sp. REN16]MCC3358005.1 CidA/LrgA family holin-like protein [Bacillus sp. REN16]
MRSVKICIQIAILYLIYWVGTLIKGLLHTSIPGSIIGMILLFLLLQTKMIKEKWLGEGAQFLLTYLALLFVPATVGIIDYLPYFNGGGIITVAIVLVSTFLVMFISGIVGEKMATRKKQSKNMGEEYGA